LQRWKQSFRVNPPEEMLRSTNLLRAYPNPTCCPKEQHGHQGGNKP
jgi:hypothetical protein